MRMYHEGHLKSSLIMQQLGSAGLALFPDPVMADLALVRWSIMILSKSKEVKRTEGK
mgnify:FL=1